MPTIKQDLATAAKIITEASAKRFVKRATYRRINDRRCDLVNKDVLTGDEKAEYEVLCAEVDRLVKLAHPLPPLPPLILEGIRE